MSDIYELERFVEAFDDWVVRGDPDQQRRYTFLAWVMTRSEVPYKDAHRAEGFDTLWYAVVPRTFTNGQAVVCSFWILEKTKTVRCDNIAILSPPV